MKRQDTMPALTMNAHEAYGELIRIAREQSVLSSCADLLEWDEETYMPRGGVAHRAEQSAVLAGMLHERQTSARMGELLATLEASDLARGGDAPAAVNIRELGRLYRRRARLPREHVEEFARARTMAQQVWVEAREEMDFGRFAPWLETMVGLARREAGMLSAGGDPYDSLVEHYEPGMTTARLTALFGSLRAELGPLLGSIVGTRKRPRTAMLRREYPVDRQKLFAQAVAAAVGFDLERGRLDVAAHPFCMAIGPGDTRLTMRYAERSFGDGFFAMLHEVGHGLYEQGLPAEHYGTPMGMAASLGMHESQSRLWENLVGRSLPFWTHFYPRLRNVFHEALADVKVEAFFLAINRVEPTALRATADEVTYNVHIMIRFELERAMLSGALAPADLPGAWNEAYRRELGVEPRDVVEGCLQDGHWAEGLFGYFPTYTLGNVYAAQVYAASGNRDEAFARGDFSGLLGWLRDHVHTQGMKHPAPELVRRVSGREPDPGALVAGLRKKYGELYGL
ncbi:MAG: carboxypeptidase M32 [Phycisphaeraceae bacterium]|nr:carboxypeptidase M32 [Phycisphaeraceae bacterium]